MHPKELNVIEITGKDLYEGVLIKRYANAISLNEVSESEEEPVIEEPIFLRLLTRGRRINLYSYIDENKTHYFIKDSTGTWTSLRYVKVYIHSLEKIAEYLIYKQQLEPYNENNEAAEKLLVNTGWREDELIKWANLVNGNATKYYAELENDKQHKKNNVFAGVGMVAGSLSISSWNVYWDKMRFTKVYSPTIYAGYHFQGGRQMPRFGLSTMVSCFYFNTTGKYYWKDPSGGNVVETMKYSYFDLSICPELLFSAIKDNSLVVGIGFKMTFPIGVSSPYTTTEINPSTGKPLFRDQLNLSNTPHIHYYGLVHYTFMHRNTIRLTAAPSLKLDDSGVTNVMQQLYTISYQIAFKR